MTDFDFEGEVKHLAQVKQQLDDLRKEYGAALMLIETTRKESVQIDQMLREQAVAYLRETGDKNPHDAIEIRFVKRYGYDFPENVEGAIEHDPSVLRVDIEKSQVWLPQIAREIVRFRKLRSEGSSMLEEQVASAEDIIGAMIRFLMVDEKHMEKLRKDDAEWIVFDETSTATPYIKSRLGEYIITEE